VDNVFLKQFANKNLKGAVLGDTNSPFSFLEWKAQSPSVPDVDVYLHYNQYILDWFSKNKQKTVSQKFVLRQKYLFLLEQLQMFFTDEEKNVWYNQVNLADEKELLSAIPYFARKLRDIAIYYLNIRKQLKNTKLKYNTVGTTKAVEHEIYSYLLNALSPNNNEYSPQLLSLVPTFSALQQSLVVTVDELYDDNQYFDRSPTAPLSGYVNLLDSATASFFQTKGIVLSSDSWLFETFNLPVTGDLNTLVNRLTGNVFEQTDVNLYGTFIQNYLAENKYTLTYSTPTSSYTITQIPLSAGNNRFYYPYGLVDTTLTIDGQLTPISLSSIQLSGAASGTTLEQSDSIFVKYGNTIKGAWYRYVDYMDRADKMDALIDYNSTTTFIYPFPGYGLSSEDIPWTGPSLISDQEYSFLPRNMKAAVQESYWSNALSSDACSDVFLNNTTAVSEGANANDEFDKADKIYLRDRNMVYDTKLPVRELSGAWLYKFAKTALPISPYQSNVIVWPYDILDTTTDQLPEHLQNQNFQDVCFPTTVQNLDTSYFVAASSIDLADKIYKLGYFTDNEQTDALECVWLSGSVDTKDRYTFVKQDGLTLSLSAGQVTRFVWTGANNTPLSSVFTSVPHQIDCPFITNNPSVSAYEWRKCTCKQPYYSPLGHPGLTFDQNNAVADFIAEDTLEDFSNFDTGSWLDLSGNDIFNSNLFAWYNTYENKTWGYGRWTSLTTVSATSSTPAIPNPDTLKLQYGKGYFYGRANSKLTRSSFPQYNVLYKFNTNNTKWIQAKPNNNKTSWITTTADASFNINAGDYLKVVRQQQTTFSYLSSYFIAESSSNKGSAWATYDYIALSDNSLLNSTTITWPTVTTVEYGDQYPSVSLTQLLTPNAPTYLTYAELTALFFTPSTSAANTPPPKTSYTPAVASTPTANYTKSGSFIVDDITTSVTIRAVGGGGGGGSAQEVNNGGAGGGGGSGGISTTSNFPVQQGDVVSFTVGAAGAGSRGSGRGSTNSGSAGGSTTITITRAGTVISTLAASGGRGGGGGWNWGGGGGGRGGLPSGRNGSNGQSGNNDYASSSGGGGGGSPYGGYGAGGRGASAFDRTNPLYWNGNAGGTGVASFTFNKQTVESITPSRPIIVLNGNSSIQMVLSSTYTDLSAKVYDGKYHPNGKTIAFSSSNLNPNLTGSYTLTYTYTATGAPLYSADPVTRTVNVYKPANIPSGVLNSPQILRWNIGNVQTSAVQSFYNTSVVTFTPNTTGTFYIEVTSRNADGELFYLYGASSPNSANATEPTIIPDLTAVPGFSPALTEVPFYPPTGGFLIEEPLQGWRYTPSGAIPQEVFYSRSDVGAKPYWATINKDKDASTNSKGVYSWGYPNEYIDGYLPHRIPRLSPLKLTYGTILEYERNGGSFWWTQPLTFKSYVGSSLWSTLLFDTNMSNLSSVFETERIKELVTFATTSASDIILTNNIDGTPVTVLYYAVSSYTWSVSTVSIDQTITPTTELYFQSQLPYANISNRFYPTIATLPTLDRLYSKNDIGGYQLPQNLGASQFINRDFTVVAPVSSTLSAQYIVEDSSIHIGGRGLTKEDQTTVYDWTENNLWMKEASTTGELAGFVRKDLTKQLQTFVPYQSNDSQSTVGLVTPQSRITPWGGPYNEQWTDLSNEPKSFTGVRNVSAWSESQVLKQNNKVVDNWVTDVYGNQYGLFKQLSGVSLSDRSSIPGELWVRTNKQVVQPAYIALSSVFSQVPSTLYSQTTSDSQDSAEAYLKKLYSELSNSVLSIDCFVDILLIQTTTAVIFTRLQYDYNTDKITTTFDDMRGYFGFPNYELFKNGQNLQYLGEFLTFRKDTF
jgi:hypothetical protein